MRTPTAIAAAALGLLGALSCGPRIPDVPPLAEEATPAGGRILWIGAHPDDELYVAPLLGAICVDGAAACTLLVAGYDDLCP